MQNPTTYFALIGRNRLLREAFSELTRRGFIKKDNEGVWQMTKRGQAICHEAELLEQKIVEQERKKG